MEKRQNTGKQGASNVFLPIVPAQDGAKVKIYPDNKEVIDMNRNISILSAVSTAQEIGFNSEELCCAINGGGTG